MLELFEILGLTGSAIMVGSNIYISAVEIPARAKTPVRQQLENWHSVFPRAMGILKPFGMAILPVYLIGGLLGGGFLWYIALLLTFALGPFTAKVIAPTNQALLGFTADTPEDEVENAIKLWGERHNIRTVITVVSFVCIAFSVVC